MASNSNPAASTPTGQASTTDTTMTDPSPPKYVPQFSAATEMILKRINSGAGATGLSSIGIAGTNTPGYEDMRRSVLMGMKTSMNMEIPSTPVGNANRRGSGAKAGGSAGGVKARASPAGTPKDALKDASAGTTPASGAKGKIPARPRGKGKAGSKRKRVEEESESTEESDVMSKLGGDSDSDGSGSIIDLPKITQSGRQIVKPTQYAPAAYEAPAKKRTSSKRTQEQALCKRCGRGHSPQSNMIVFCDGCNLGWHQMCHDPAVSDEAVKDESSPWFCADCSRKRGIKPVEQEQVRGVSWQGRSSEEKRGYLNSLPHQQLVSLLMQATALHPNIPIFPPTANAQPIQAYVPPGAKASRAANPQQPFPPSATSTSGLFSRSESNPNAPINFIRKIQTPPLTTSASSFPPPPPQSQSSFTHASSAPPTLNPQSQGYAAGGEESRESTPASPPYPKPGNGLMAKLGPDDEDIEWLVDDNDFDAFSHTIYDEQVARVEENGVPVNGI